MLYKDSANKKSNQKNLGTIKSSNLCTEIIEYSDSEQYACCTLTSYKNLNHFIKSVHLPLRGGSAKYASAFKRKSDIPQIQLVAFFQLVANIP